MTVPTPRRQPLVLSDAASARALLGRIVAWNLPACDGPLPDRALADLDWARLLALTRTQRAEGPVAQAIASEALVVTARQQHQAFAAHRAAMSLTLLLERDLLAVHTELAAADVDLIVLKGAATSHLDEADPAALAFGDVDLLIRGSTLPAAIRVIEEMGGTRRNHEPRPGYDTRFGKGVSFRFTRNCEIDLHRTLAPGPFGLRVDLDELFASRQRYEIGGVGLTALDRPSRFLHACYHAVLGDAFPRLTTLRDLVNTAPRSDHECRIALGRAARWQAISVVGAAIDHAVGTFGWTPPEPLRTWARLCPQPPREQRWLAAYTGGDRLPALQALQGLAALEGFGERVAYARAIAWPTSTGPHTPTRVRARRGARALTRIVRP